MDWINEIHTNEDYAISELYRQFRGEAVNWLRKKYSLDEMQCIEVFQESVIILYDNVISGKLTELSSTLKSYLFSICKNKAKEHLRHHYKYDNLENLSPLKLVEDNQSEENEALEMNIEIMNKCLDKIGDPCKTLLELFYYKKIKMEEISTNMGYNNANTAKNQKYKCIKRLQNLFKEHIESNEYYE